MKTLAIMVGALLLMSAGCGELPSSEPAETTNNELSVFKVDDCEYVVFDGYKQGGVCHKGDCSNPIHQSK